MSSAEVTTDYGSVLDELAAALFDGRGRSRLDPLLQRFDRDVGALHEDEPAFVLFQAIRLDWALCDAPVDATQLGDTWAWRVARGRVDGIEASPKYQSVARSVSGLFEVWPGTPVWLRDRVGGLCAPLADPVTPWLPTDAGVAALWELRVVLDAKGAHLCRPALEYPLEILPVLERAHERRFEPGGPQLAMSGLRRAWVKWRRAGRADARAFFSSLCR